MLVHPQFDPIAFSVGPLAVRWYGLMYLIGFVLFVVLGRHRARQNMLTGWRPRDIDDMLFYGVFGVILGGRLGYVLFYKPLYYLQHPLEVFALWQGGMSFHGGFLGVIFAMWLFARGRRQALARRHRLRRAAGAAGARRRAPGQFHQRRAVGARDAGALGDGVSAGRSRAAAPVAALPVRARGAAAVRRAVAVHQAATADRRDVGAVPRGIRRRAASSPNLPASRTRSWARWRWACRWGSGCRCR